tara:strand:- start:110 stop:1120 length:1011 start_codon:yes stop_codon:yes gene_type:complete
LRVARQILNWIPLSFVAKLAALFRQRIILIFVYHHTADISELEAPQSIVISQSHNVPPKEFGEQISALQNAGISFINLAKIFETTLKPGISAAITFDDGYRSVRDYAAPILKNANIPFTIFLTTNLLEGDVFWRDVIAHAVGAQQSHLFLEGIEGDVNSESFSRLSTDLRKASKDPNIYKQKLFERLVNRYTRNHLKNGTVLRSLYLNVDDLKKLEKAGANFGNHSCGHPIMKSLSEENAKEEFLGAHEFLIGNDLHVSGQGLFALPFGGRDLHDNPFLPAYAQSLGYRHYLYTDGQANSYRNAELTLDRIPAPTAIDQFLYSAKSAVTRAILGRN